MKQEQEARVKQYKDTLELDIRIKSFEEEGTLSQQERYQLSHDIEKLTRYQNDLFSKIKESEEVLNTCLNFLEKNGVVQTSFFSSDENMGLD